MKRSTKSSIDRGRIFIDTGAFYALFVKNDDYHKASLREIQRLRKARSRLVTSDYIVDETATLFQARRVPEQASQLFELVHRSHVLRIEWVGESRFFEAMRLFERNKDKDYSFTDCTSFILMKELGIQEAMTTDRHFEQAGFKSLLR